MTEVLFVKLIESLMGGDQGVNEETYNILTDIAYRSGFETATDLLFHADATDGEFYL